MLLQLNDSAYHGTTGGRKVCMVLHGRVWQPFFLRRLLLALPGMIRYCSMFLQRSPMKQEPSIIILSEKINDLFIRDSRFGLRTLISFATRDGDAVRKHMV